MTTKGSHRYRGRNTRGKVALVVVLVLILLAAVAYLLTQEYVVYDDEGKAHLELPWSRKEPEKPQPDSTPVPDDVDITREEPQRQKVEAIHAWELPYGCLGSDPGYLLTDREAVAVNVKMYDGSVAYHTAVALPEGILTGGLSVRQTEALVKRLSAEKKEPKKKQADAVDYLAEAQNELKAKLCRGVKIVSGRKKGRIELEYYGLDDLNDLLDALALIKINKAKEGPQA